MDFTLDKKSNNIEATLSVKISENDYKEGVDKKIKDYSKQAQIKGFRQGKVPLGVIQKMYGTSILVDEINQMLGKSVSDYIKNNKLKTVGDPLPRMDESTTIDWENQKDFEFKYDLGLVDDFKYDLTKSTKVINYIIEVDKKDLSATLTNLTEQYGKTENPEKAEAEDLIFGDATQEGMKDALVTVIPVKDLKKKDQEIFIGLKKGDKVEVELKKLFSKDEDLAKAIAKTEEEAKAIKGKFELEVKNITRTIPGELNQELFDKVLGPGTVKDETEFKEKVKEVIGENYASETNAYLFKSIQEKYTEDTKLALPEEFLKDWLLKTNEKLTPEQLETEFGFYVKELKWNIIKGQIAEDNEIKVENEEVLEKTKAMFRTQFGGMGTLPPEMETQMDTFADNYLKAENGDNYLKIFNEVHTEKIKVLIKEKITIKDKKVTVDEFKKVVSK